MTHGMTMSDDLIERLREPLDKRLPLRVHNERREAADEIERLLAVYEAAEVFAALARMRVWEDKELNACGMRGGEAIDVHALRGLEKDIAAVQTRREPCAHEWVDIAIGGQYCRLCDERRDEQRTDDE
jgi:hypothetical protein